MFRVFSRHLLPIVAASGLALGGYSGAFGQSGDDLSSRIFNKEVELMQMTTQFRQHNPRETALHRWTIAVLSTVAYGIADAGNIVTFTNGFRYHTHPQNFSVGRAESGPFLIFLGELFFLSRTTSAVTLDLLHRAELRHTGFDRNTYENHAAALRNEIDTLLKQRQSSIQPADVAAQKEQALLVELDRAAQSEFARNYARAAQVDSYTLWDDLIGNYTSGTGAFAGGLPTYLAAVQSRPRLTGPGGIGFICSGSGFIADHAIARYVSLQAEKRSYKHLGLIDESAPAVESRLKDNLAQWRTAAPDADAGGDRRRAYQMAIESFASLAILDARDRQRARRKFWHDQLFDSVEGGANIGAGSIIANAGFRYNPGANPLKKFMGARHFLTRFAWGAVTFAPTATAGIVDTPGEAIVTDMVTARDCARALCPEVILSKRTEQLEMARRLVPVR